MFFILVQAVKATKHIQECKQEEGEEEGGEEWFIMLCAQCYNNTERILQYSLSCVCYIKIYIKSICMLLKPVDLLLEIGRNFGQGRALRQCVQ